MSLKIKQCYINVGNDKLSYQLKSGGDRCILFIHGLGCSKESFKHAFDGNYFTKAYTLLAPDLLGYGDSSKPVDFSYTLEKQCTSILELIRKLNPRHLNIVAHSMGSVIALLLIEQLNNVQSFFCLEGNLVIEDCHISRKVSSLDETTFVNKIYPMSPSTFACKGLSLEKMASPVAFYRSAKSLFHWSSYGGLLEKYRNLSIPKTYFYGAENKEIYILQKLEKEDIVQINGCGHFMMIDNPSDTYRGITDRLNNIAF